mmetsp:Transcript_87064/g.195043  ORF Transcript_87064/g.195043 Transcript_87064/m.195043 type:complete len:278 (-) Transcript_87064:582-1415(-)
MWGLSSAAPCCCPVSPCMEAHRHFLGRCDADLGLHLELRLPTRLALRLHVPDQAPVDLVPPMGVRKLQAKLAQFPVLIQGLCQGLELLPTGRLAELVAAIQLLQRRLRAGQDREEAPEVIWPEEVARHVKRPEGAVRDERRRQAHNLFAALKVRVPEAQPAEVRIANKCVYELAGNARLPAWERHGLARKVKLGEARVVQCDPVHHPHHPRAQVSGPPHQGDIPGEGQLDVLQLRKASGGADLLRQSLVHGVQRPSARPWTARPTHRAPRGLRNSQS